MVCLEVSSVDSSGMEMELNGNRRFYCFHICGTANLISIVKSYIFLIKRSIV